MTEPGNAEFEAEVAAIGVILNSLGPLAAPARERVLDYVTKALDVRLGGTAPLAASPLQASVQEVLAADETHELRRTTTDIRSLKDSKEPRSAIEMAAVVAYYLSELAPSEDRKEFVDTSDLEKHFKQANFPLPGKLADTLPNAAAAGYLDRVERGRYRLNPVGYNLVAHNLPSGSADPTPRRRPGRTAASKKASAKAVRRPGGSKKAAAKKTVVRKTTPKKAS